MPSAWLLPSRAQHARGPEQRQELAPCSKPCTPTAGAHPIRLAAAQHRAAHQVPPCHAAAVHCYSIQPPLRMCHPS